MLPRKRPPAHPGQILEEEFMGPANITQTALAKHLGGTWTQVKLSEIIRGKRGITERTALDLADAFGTTALFWLNLQNQFNLWHAEQDHKPVKKIIAFNQPYIHQEEDKEILEC